MPVITPRNDGFQLSEHQVYYYRANIYETGELLDDLIIVLKNNAGFSITKLDNYGLIKIDVGDLGFSASIVTSFEITVTDQNQFPKSATETFGIFVTPINDRPQIIQFSNEYGFTNSQPIKQFLWTGFKQGREDKRSFKINDSDTNLSELNLRIVGYNHYKITITRSIADNSVFEVSWTPGFYEFTSGVVKFEVYEVASETNKEIAEIIIYDVEKTLFQTFFTKDIPIQTISERDILEIELEYYNPYKRLDQLTVSLRGTDGTNLSLKGKGTIVREPQVMSGEILNREIFVQICDDESTPVCSETSFILNINALNDSPNFVK